MTTRTPPLDVMAAAGPDPEFADELRLFGQFVGSWDLEVVYHEPDGERRLSAEWHFAWALNGRAVHDVWIAPSRRDRARGEPPVEWGTSVRFYDPRIDAWRSTWIGPLKALVLPFTRPPGRRRDRARGPVRRREHHPLDLLGYRRGQLRWRAVESDDDGHTWSLVQEMSARRVQEASAQRR